MSEVQRFNNLGRPCLNGCFVGSSDYDAAQSELAALREELRIANEYCDAEQALMQSKLTAAEQRNATLETELRNIRQSCELSKLRDARIDALLTKPTESGASE